MITDKQYVGLFYNYRGFTYTESYSDINGFMSDIEQDYLHDNESITWAKLYSLDGDVQQEFNRGDIREG